MACATSEPKSHLVSWNIKGHGRAEERKNTVSTYLGALTPPADVLFLQEVQWVPPKLPRHLPALGDPGRQHYELSQYTQEYESCYNCVLFDTRKFQELTAELKAPLKVCYKLLDKRNEWEKKGFSVSQKKQMRNRMCVVVLCDRRTGYKFIAASLHNLNDKMYSIKMAELFLQLLALVGDSTGYPVVLAGDFNANIRNSSAEVEKLGFTVPEYKPTIHRLKRKSPIDATIDFFLYRAGKGGSVVLQNVRAELACSDVVDHKGIIDDKKMDMLHKVSNHDPLQATLQLSGTKSAQSSVTATRKPAAMKPVVKESQSSTITAAPIRVKQESVVSSKPRVSDKAISTTRIPPMSTQIKSPGVIASTACTTKSTPGKAGSSARSSVPATSRLPSGTTAVTTSTTTCAKQESTVLSKKPRATPVKAVTSKATIVTTSTSTTPPKSTVRGIAPKSSSTSAHKK